MNVYRQELRLEWRSMFAWIGVLALVTLLFLSIFPSFSHDIEASRKLLEGLPPQLRDAFGLSLNTFFSFLGFYAYVFTYIGLAGAVQAMNLGLGILSREARSKTTDFLLTKPVARRTIFMQKLLAALTVLLVTNTVLVAVTLLLARLFGAGEFSLRTFGILALAFLIVQLIFLALGLLVSQLMRVKSIITISLAIVFGFFAVGMVQAMTGDEALRYVSPFKFFDHMKIVTDKTFETPFVWLSVAIVIGGIAAAYSIYRHRDVRNAA